MMTDRNVVVLGRSTLPARPDDCCDPDQLAEVLTALASPSRLEIVRLLAEGELDVGDIARRLQLSVANTSHHLGRLRRAGLVVARRQGTRITNRLAGSYVLDLCAAACDTARARATDGSRTDA